MRNFTNSGSDKKTIEAHLNRGYCFLYLILKDTSSDKR